MAASHAVLFVFDGFADWQTALACTELSRLGHASVRTIGLTKSRVRSASGLVVIPAGTIEEVATDTCKLLLLPGGTFWLDGEVSSVTELVRQLRGAGVRIAAIGEATVALARAGLFGSTRHTSNGLHWLRTQYSEYRDEGHYVAVPSVTDDGLITASASGIIDFAHEIIKALDLLDEPARRAWLRSMRDGVLPLKE